VFEISIVEPEGPSGRAPRHPRQVGVVGEFLVALGNGPRHFCNPHIDIFTVIELNVPAIAQPSEKCSTRKSGTCPQPYQVVAKDFDERPSVGFHCSKNVCALP
jgi:hypothetical protein